MFVVVALVDNDGCVYADEYVEYLDGTKSLISQHFFATDKMFKSWLQNNHRSCPMVEYVA